jgi:hypothetical protein
MEFMRYTTKLSYILILIFASRSVPAQSSSSKDSMLTIHIHQVCHADSMSASQENAFLALEINFSHSLDSLGAINLSASQRQTWLTNNLQSHDQQLKAIMTVSQWTRYTTMLQNERNLFMTHASTKNIGVIEIVRTNL